MFKKSAITIAVALSLTACSNMSGKGVAKGVAGALMVGGLVVAGQDEDSGKNKDEAEKNKEQGWGLVAVGGLMYYLIGKNDERIAKNKIEKQARERKAMCDAKSKKVKANEILLKSHYAAISNKNKAIESCSSIRGKKPIEACTELEKENYGTVICSNSKGGCSKLEQEFKKILGKEITKKQCKLLGLKFKRKFSYVDNAAEKSTTSIYKEGAKKEVREGDYKKAILYGAISMWSKKEGFENCTYEVSRNCSDNYRKWKKENTIVDQKCVSQKLSYTIETPLNKNIVTKLSNENREYESLCK